ncbi:MAG: Phosphomannomutase [Candidatus Moranbacteria bacterium GW2011_GWC2_37_73]|nr:MAG: Phosphomannomutase [Candidatus Moranbacteria bacterium GW2011_GWC2_37_73]
MNKSIFKAYDIRGLYPQDLNGQDAYQIGRAIVQHTNAKTIVIGADMRTSSPEIQAGLHRTREHTNVIFCFLEIKC